MKRTPQPRHRLTDLLATLPRGGQKQIAQKLNIPASRVSDILNGKADQSTPTAINVIRLAERKANVNGR